MFQRFDELSDVFSYAHDDDSADGGRIVQLTQHLEAEYALLTGNGISVIIDVSHLRWGDDWSQRLSDAVAESTFFICVITPRFFMSTECRRELQDFADIATKAGRQALVLPLYYVNVDDLGPQSADPLRAYVSQLQWFDWRDARLAAVGTEPYRVKVNELAAALITRLQELDDPAALSAAAEVEGIAQVSTSPTEQDGLLERLLAGLSSLESVATHVDGINSTFVAIGEASQRRAGQLVSTGDAKTQMARRIHVANQLAHDLAPLSEDIHKRVSDYVAEVEKADDFIDSAFELASYIDAAEQDEPTRFAAALIDLSNQTQASFQEVDALIAAIRNVEPLTKNLRAPAGLLRISIQTFRDTESRIQAWARRAEQFLQDAD